MIKDDMIVFSNEIEKIVKEKNISYLDSILNYCEVTGLDVEMAPKLISGVLMVKLQNEAEKLNIIPKTTSRKLHV